MNNRPVVLVVMDGVGERESDFGNAVKNANTPTLDYLRENDCDMTKIRISHNFYPKRYTGLSYEDVKAKNEIFHK